MSINHEKNIIEISNLSFSYGDIDVLKDINLKIHEGDYISLVGPNGSGKTTLLEIMLGLLKPKTGSVSLFGSPINKFKDWSKIGYVAQKATNFDPLFPVTVREVVSMGRYAPIGLFRWLSKNDDEIVNHALDQVEMRQFSDRLIGDLSGGQQQRVFIARALAAQPQIIFLDEPTVGVDLKSQEDFYSILRKLNRDLGITLILISHDIDVISKEVTEIACLNQTLVYHGDPNKFIKGKYLENLYGGNASFVEHNH